MWVKTEMKIWSNPSDGVFIRLARIDEESLLYVFLGSFVTVGDVKRVVNNVSKGAKIRN